MSNQPLISVIVPVYNVAAYLPRCLDSICNQTYQNLEIIIVDDGSTDNSLEICQQYAKQDKRITVVHQKNKGLPATRNVGLGYATGTFFTFVDGDDWILPSCYQILMQAQQQTQGDIVACDFAYTTGEQTEPAAYFSLGQVQKLSLENFLCLAVSQNNFSVCNKLFLRSAMEHLQFNSHFTICEDWNFLLIALQKASCLVHVEQALYVYRQHPQSMSRSLDSYGRYLAMQRWFELWLFCRKKKFTQAYELVQDALLGFTSTYVLPAILEGKEPPRHLKQAHRILRLGHRALWKNTYMGWYGKIFSELFLVFPRLTAWIVKLPGISRVLTKTFVQRIAKTPTHLRKVKLQAQQKPCKIFQFCNHFHHVGGIEQLLISWYRQANKETIWFDFGILSNYDLDFSFRNKVISDAHQFLVPEKGTNNLLARFSFYIKLWRTLRRRKYQIFCYHDSSPMLLLNCLIAKLAGVPRVCLFIHSTMQQNPPLSLKIQRIISRWCISCFTHVRLAVSQQAGLAAYGKKLTFKVCPTGIDTSLFAYDPLLRQKTRTELGLTNNWVIGYTARFSAEKNHSFLLRIFQHILTRKPTAKLLLVGDGPLEKEIRQEVHRQGLDPFVLFVGNQPNPTPYYQAFDVFVFPSLFEGLPLAALEAQTCGLPCFFSQAIVQEALVCNTYTLPLTAGAVYWGNEILEKTKNFKRIDCAFKVKQKGLDIHQSLERLYSCCK